MYYSIIGGDIVKEASGELSMTAITVVAIAAIAGLFSVFLLPGLKGTITKKTHCSQAFDCDSSGNNCTYCKNDECTETGTVNCGTSNTKTNNSGTTPG